eukprot:234811-Alexandrium_andersonii.AAC.1
MRAWAPSMLKKGRAVRSALGRSRRGRRQQRRPAPPATAVVAKPSLACSAKTPKPPGSSANP